jgi:tetratricopeptide (TPR) repeat protein
LNISFHKYLTVFILFCFLKNKAGTRFQDSIRQIVETTTNDTLKINCWNILSVTNSNRGYYILGEKCAYEALVLATRIGFDKGIADAYYHLGISFSRRSKYDKAVEYYLKSIPIYEKTGNKNGVAWTTLLIGVVDYYLENIDKAEREYKKALVVFEETKNKLGMANCLVNLSVLYNLRKDYSTSIKYSEEAYDLFEESSLHGRAECLSNIANCYCELYLKNLKEGKKEIAEDYLHQAVKVYNENIKTYTKLAMPAERAGTYINLYKVVFRAKNYPVAKMYLDSAYSTMKDVGNVQAAKMVYNGFYEWYLAKGDSAKALRYYLDYSAAKDSIFNTDQLDKMDAINVQFAELEKQKEIDLLTKDKEKRGVILWGVGLLAILAAALSVLFFIRYRDKKSANKELTEQKKIIEDKNKEITDSIHYAKRIQSTLLPKEKYIDKILKRRTS